MVGGESVIATDKKEVDKLKSCVRCVHFSSVGNIGFPGFYSCVRPSDIPNFYKVQTGFLRIATRADEVGGECKFFYDDGCPF